MRKPHLLCVLGDLTIKFFFEGPNVTGPLVLLIVEKRQKPEKNARSVAYIYLSFCSKKN